MPVSLHGLLTNVGDAAQFPFAGECLMQQLKLIDELFAHGTKDFARRLAAIRLDTNEKLRDIWMGELVAGHVHVGMFLDMLGEKISQGMIFLVEDEIRGVGHSRVHLFLDLLLAICEQEEFEARGVISG